MTLEVAIEVGAGSARAALLQDGRLIEVRFAGEDDLNDRIALGRVIRVERDLDAAFLDIGRPEPGYLHGARAAGVREGEARIVQIRRDATPGKGVTLTTEIALIGRLLMLRPGQTNVQLSAELARSPERKAHKARARALFAHGGLVLRTAAAKASDADLAQEAEELRQRWQAIEARAIEAKCPAWLEPQPPPVLRLLSELMAERPDRIVIGDAAAVASARTWLEHERPAAEPALERAAAPFEATGAADQLAQALLPEVPLVCGGRLIIQPTAACVAIDVDGGARGALEVDLEAAQEIARQVRLRALGGTIVVDFVDLPDPATRKRVDKALQVAFQGDPEPVRIWPMGPLGLVQVSRRRRGPSLAERVLTICPACGGHGRVERVLK